VLKPLKNDLREPDRTDAFENIFIIYGFGGLGSG
jgi:hypothetical protein